MVATPDSPGPDVVYSRHVTMIPNESADSWPDVVVPLAAFEGDRVALFFNTNVTAPPRVELGTVRAVWVEPQIVTH